MTGKRRSGCSEAPVTSPDLPDATSGCAARRGVRTNEESAMLTIYDGRNGETVWEGWQEDPFDIGGLLDFHRGLFGDARMEDAGGDAGAGDGADGDASADSTDADSTDGGQEDKPDPVAEAEAKVAQARKEAAD